MANEQNQNMGQGTGHGNKLQIKAEDKALSGVYSNAAQISHTKEEVVLDFFLMHPPMGKLQSRVIMSPGHAKRLAAALTQNIKNYEKSHGDIKAAEAPAKAEDGSTTGELGFSSK